MNALAKLSIDQLWAEVRELRRQIDEAQAQGTGLPPLERYTGILKELLARVRVVRPKPTEEWAISDNEENWGCCEDHSSREDAVASLKDYAEEYGVEPHTWLYVARKTPCNDMLSEHLETDEKVSRLICADDLVNCRIHEFLELHEDCTVSKDDTQDLQHRLRLTLQEWNRARSPFGGWWHAQQMEEFWWDGETVVPRNERKDREEAQKGV